MRLLILTARPDVSTNRRLVDAADEAGVPAHIVDATRVVAGVGHGPQVISDHCNLAVGNEGVVVIARIGNWRPQTMLGILETLLRAGAVTPNSPEAIRRGRDHWQTIVSLADAGLPVPASVCGLDPGLTARTAVERLGLPVVVKVRHSRMGIGVVLCRELDHLECVCDSLWRVGDEFLLQEMIPSGGRSTRALVVGGDVVAAARFSSCEGEWRSNGALGGVAQAIDLDDAQVGLAKAAADSVGLGVCGVDLLPGPHGPVVCEVNPTPGFVRLESATGRDVAGAMVRWALTLRRRRSG
jgi:ribosomal protein S6--L-glutamate ligase